MSSGLKRSAAATSPRSAARTPRSARWSPSWAGKGVRVPPGFATTADAYWHYIEANGLKQSITDALGNLAAGKATLAETGASIRRMFLKGQMAAGDRRGDPRGLCRAVQARGQGEVDVAVRSSATAEDLPEASFAGQQETFLNVRGDAALLDACRRCYASLFTDRAISYREAKGFDHMKVALSIGVQRMVRSDLGGVRRHVLASTPRPASTRSC